MTCCLAAKCDGGVVVASDSLLSLGSTKLFKPQLKMHYYGDLACLYAGTLHTIDKVFSEQPSNIAGVAHGLTQLQQLQHRCWDMKKELNKEPSDFLVVDEFGAIHILSGYGDCVSGFEFACIGSEFGWVGLDLVMDPTLRSTPNAVKLRLLKVLRAVARRDASVSAPFFTEVL